MKHTFLLILAAVLSGILCGLPGVSIVWKLSIPVFTIGMAVVLFLKCRGNDKNPLLFLLFLVFLAFIAGLGRTKKINSIYSSEENACFFEKYESTNPGEFNYAIYLKTIGVTNESDREALKERNYDNESIIERITNNAKEKCSFLIDGTLNEKEAGIMKAMLLGDKTNMETETKELYQSAGISHLLAVSGLHVGFIGTGCYMALSFFGLLSKKANLLITSFAVCLYCYFTGMAASSQRAAFMLCFGFAAVIKGRKNDPVSSLSAAAVFLLFQQPYLLLQSGFLLSFSAMAGVFTCSCLLNRFEIKSRIVVSFISSVLISITTMPIIASSYYQVPVFSVILNMIVIPLMSILFLSGFCLLISAYIYSIIHYIPVISGFMYFLIRIFSFLCNKILFVYEFLGKLSLTITNSQIVTGKPGHFKILIFYILFALILVYLIRNKAKIGRLLPVALCAVYAVSFPFLVTKDTDDTYVEILDVGQGDCIHIHEGKRNIIIDCGSSGYERAGSRVLEPYLLSKGISHLDMIIVSHADSDHINGLLYLLNESKSVSVDSVILPSIAEIDEKYNVFSQTAVTKKICHKGDAFKTGEGRLNCLYSKNNEQALKDTNKGSCVWMYEYDNLKILFTGDISSDEEAELIKEDKNAKLKNLTVLKAAHHGSDTANSDEFINYTDPAICVLSYGINNRYGHPSSDVIDRLRESETSIISTAEKGAIKITYEKRNCNISTWK